VMLMEGMQLRYWRLCNKICVNQWKPYQWVEHDILSLA
jgi:hypothetical protein